MHTEIENSYGVPPPPPRLVNSPLDILHNTKDRFEK